MRRKKIVRLAWVVLLVASSFILGYTLRPKTGHRPPALDLRAMMNSGRFQMLPEFRSFPGLRWVPGPSLPWLFWLLCFWLPSL